MKENKIQDGIAGKAAIVTGATRGIGRAIAERLLREGARVAICGVDAGRVDGAAREMAGLGEVFGAVADVSKLEDVRRFMGGVEERFGGVDILVNNAGAGVFRSVAELAPEEWEKMLGLNLTGVYYCCHEILPIFRKNAAGGDIINISSLAAVNAFAGGAGYNATKFGLNGFSEAMMLDHRKEGVRVSSIMPGSVDTDFGGAAGSRQGDEWKIAPEDVADVVVTLLRMPRRTTVSRGEIRPSIPGKK